MKRWHEEKALMMKRWKIELSKHEPWNLGRELAKGKEARTICGITLTGKFCHCEIGPGSCRKKRPYGHPSQCSCKAEKWWKNKYGKLLNNRARYSVKYGRQDARRRALKWEAVAEGGFDPDR